MEDTEKPTSFAKVQGGIESFKGTLSHLGAAEVEFSVRKQSVHHPIFITNEKTCPLLGLKSSLTLDWVSIGKNKRRIHVKLVTKETLEADHADVFQGFG